MKYIIRIVSIIIITTTLFAQNNFNCFSIIAGKNCTVDGSVLFGHNEDDSGDQIVNIYKVPRLTHTNDEKITLLNGGKCQQVPETNAYIWLEMPGMKFSDGYLNEYNVVIASDNCPSKEDKPELTDGGIGYWLRRLMAERAKSAREAVEIGGKLVEKFGYDSPGRSYCIADPNEAWVMSVVNGKHWVAQRVPDDKVMIIPNYYMIQEIDLSDSDNFMGSTDIIDYAVSRGWYNPQEDDEFNFREVYGIDWSINHTHNINRQWGGLRLIAKDKFDMNDNFPFAMTPKKKLDVSDIFAVLRDHYEGTDLENIDHSLSPHKTETRTICTHSTQYGFVAQLQSNLPKEIAGVMWYAPVQPCLHPFVPVYINTMEFSPFFAHEDYKTGLELHFDENYAELKKEFERHHFQEFTEFSHKVNEDYKKYSLPIIKHYSLYEKEQITKHKEYAKLIKRAFNEDPSLALDIMTEYSQENLFKLLDTQFIQK